MILSVKGIKNIPQHMEQALHIYQTDQTVYFF